MLVQDGREGDRRGPLSVVGAAVLAVWVLPSPAWAAQWAPGDVVVSIANGSHNVYDNTGGFKETLYNGLGGFTAGCVFDSTGDLWATDATNNRVVKYSQIHPHPTLLNFLTDGAPPADVWNQSLVFDAAGSLYVGHQCPLGQRPCITLQDIHRYDANGSSSRSSRRHLSGRARCGSI